MKRTLIAAAALFALHATPAHACGYGEAAQLFTRLSPLVADIEDAQKLFIASAPYFESFDIATKRQILNSATNFISELDEAEQVGQQAVDDGCIPSNKAPWLAVLKADRAQYRALYARLMEAAAQEGIE